MSTTTARVSNQNSGHRSRTSIQTDNEERAMTINDELRAMRARVEAMECGDAEWSDAANHLTTHDLPKLLDAVERVMALKPITEPDEDNYGFDAAEGYNAALDAAHAIITEALDS